MSNQTVGPIYHRVCSVLERASHVDCSDASLLDSFLHHQDEQAFEALIHRHGPMVMEVCRSTLGNDADAEDAFQATFFILAQKLSSIRNPATLACWLHGVAYRTSLQLRTRLATRRKYEKNVLREESTLSHDPSWSEVRQLIHKELEGLSPTYQAPLILCYLQGKTQDEAARQLGMSKSTLKRRLERGRSLLRDRLTRRGIGLTSGLLLASWPCAVSATVESALCSKTAHAARLVLNGNSLQGVSSACVSELLQQSSRVFTRTVMTICALLVLVGGVIGLAAYSLSSTEKSTSRLQPSNENKEKRHLDQHGDSLPERAVTRLGTLRFRANAWIEQTALMPHKKQIFGIASQSVILWDAKTGKEIRQFQPPRTLTVAKGNEVSLLVQSIAVSPDGKVLAVGTHSTMSARCPIYLFEVATGKKLGQLSGHQGVKWTANVAMEFLTPRQLVSVGADHLGHVWDIERKETIRQLEFPEKSTITQLVLSPTRKHIYIASRLAEANCWNVYDVTTGKLISKGPELPNGFLHLALSPDEKTLAIILGQGEIGQANGSNEVRLYSTENGKELKRWKAHRGKYPQRNSVAFSLDGKRLATGGADHTVKQWDISTGEQLGELIKPYQYANKVRYVDAQTLMTHGSQHTLRFWDSENGKEKLSFAGAQSHLQALAYSPDGRYVACAGGGGDATIRVWEVATSRQVAHLQAGMSDVTYIKFSPKGDWIASADSNGLARIWDWRKSKEIQQFSKHQAWLYSLVFHPDGKQLATGDQAGVIRVWDLATGKMKLKFEGHTSFVTQLVFTDNGKTLFSAGWDHSIRRWDLINKKALWNIRETRPFLSKKPIGHRGPVTGLTISPGGNWLYSCSYDSYICVWDAKTGGLVKVLKRPEKNHHSNNAIALSPNGQWLAATPSHTGNDTSIELWNLLTGERVEQLQGHRGKVSQLAFSPDSQRLASASVDTTVLVWSIPSNKANKQNKSIDLDKLLSDLTGDFATAYQAMCQCVLAGDKCVEHLSKTIKPIKKAKPTQIAELIQQLDSRRFQIREKATQQLMDLGESVEASLRKHVSQTESKEVRTRIQRILEGFSRKAIRSIRVREVLLMIGTKKAKRILSSMPPVLQSLQHIP